MGRDLGTKGSRHETEDSAESGLRKCGQFSAEARRMELIFGTSESAWKIRVCTAISRGPKVCSELQNSTSERRTAFLKTRPQQMLGHALAGRIRRQIKHGDKTKREAPRSEKTRIVLEMTRSAGNLGGQPFQKWQENAGHVLDKKMVAQAEGV